MSATLEEHEMIAKWINAQTFVSNFRPLKLQEFIYMDYTVREMDMTKVRELSKELQIKSDVKGVIG